jgi:hypothetical protein
VELRSFSLRKHEEIGLALRELAPRRAPEIHRHAARNVATEAVDVRAVDPELHGGQHRGAKAGVVVVELRHIGPVGLVPFSIACIRDRAISTMDIPVRVLGDPRVVERAVVRNPVEDHVHASLVRRGDE